MSGELACINESINDVRKRWQILTFYVSYRKQISEEEKVATGKTEEELKAEEDAGK